MISKKNFLLLLMTITLLGGLIRFININYASLWSDELYSALLANPHNSWYEVLYWQRAYQPPLYALILWAWIKVFAYNEFYIRLLTVLAGTACITISGFLGKKIKDEKLGIILAILVAFNPVQIYYSLEARFYAFIYLFAAISLLIYWHLLVKKPKGWFIYFVKGIVDAILCYFHHFGILFIFAQFVYDVGLLVKERDVASFRRKIAGYVWAGILYAPWVLWGLTEGMAVTQYWLKDTDISAYLMFGLGYSQAVNYSLLLLIAVSIYYASKKLSSHYIIFPIICIIATIVPVAFSYVKMPILVPRYAMIIAPVIYLMVGLGLLCILSLLGQRSKLLSTAFLFIFFCLIIIPAIDMSFVDRTVLQKQPWREMGNWLKKQPDIETVKVYSQGAYVKKSKDIDFYLGTSYYTYRVENIKVGDEKKMYLVGCNPTDIKNLLPYYNIREQKFNKEGDKDFSLIYICTLK